MENVIRTRVFLTDISRWEEAAKAHGEVFGKIRPGSTFIEIKSAIEVLFKVSVTDIRTQIVRGKQKRVGRFAGQRPAWKKAYVRLKAGDQIAFFEGV